MKFNRLRWVGWLATTLLLGACSSEDSPAPGGDFSLLAKQAEDYKQARPGRKLTFPEDHGAHPDYRIEWWYLTANLADSEGTAYGAQWTLFRLAVRPPNTENLTDTAQDHQVFMAHMAITTSEDHVAFQRYARGEKADQMARASVSASPFSARLDDWVLQSDGDDWLPLRVHARQGDYAMDLYLQSHLPPVLQGDAGFSRKHADGGGSHYYSQPFLKASGELTVNGQKVSVTGDAWLDREWGSQFLQSDQVGWDWFSIHLDNGEKLMLFRLRERVGGNGSGEFLDAALINVDGRRSPLDAEQVKIEVVGKTIVMGRNLPMKWHVRLPQMERDFMIEALHPNQWMNVDFPYWEGAVVVSGAGPENSGRGYMELTGYPLK